MVYQDFRTLTVGTFAALLAVVPAGMAAANEVDAHSATSLGELTETSDRIAVVRVDRVGQGEVTATVVTDLKWCRRKALTIPKRQVFQWQAQQLILVFLELDSRSRIKPLEHDRQVVLLSDAEEAEPFIAAVRSRLDSVTMGDAERRLLIFSQLESSHPRIRDDAALDLVRSGASMGISSYERTILISSMRQHPTPQILSLAGAVGDEELLGPLLTLAREANSPGMGQDICRALTRVDLKAAESALGRDLASGDSVRAVKAARLLGQLGGRRAGSFLSEALEDRRVEVQLEAIIGLGECRAASDYSEQLEGLVWTLKDPRSVQSTLAALALDGALESLQRIARDHPQRDVRRLASQLRRDRGTMARDLLHP